MMKKDLLDLTYTHQEIKEKTKEIYNQIHTQSDNIDQGNYTSIAISDLRFLFELYDQIFFNNFFAKNYEDKIFFRLSKRMTKVAGKTQRFIKTNDFMISLSTTLIFQTFNDITREIKVNGIICSDRLEATMRVFEHEIIHVIEHILFDNSSCSKPFFKRLAHNMFGHTDVTHQLITQMEVAHENFNLHVGDIVSFEYEGNIHEGFVNRVTKRATVMVKDGNGQFKDSNGNRYAKFYIPLQHLTKIDS